TVVDLESAIFETATNVRTLLPCIRDRFGEFDCLAQLAIVLVDPGVELVEQRQRVFLSKGQSFVGRAPSRLLLDLVELLDQLDWCARPSVAEDQGLVESAPHMHHASQATFGWNHGAHAVGCLDEADVAL